MLFQVYGDGALWQFCGWLMVFVGLVLANEIARRSKAGGIFFFPLFQDTGKFAVLPVLYRDGVMNAAVHPGAADPVAMGVIAIIALAVNVIVLGIIIKRAKQLGINPYTHEVFVGTKDYDEAYARSL